jgi:hypothetical protein
MRRTLTLTTRTPAAACGVGSSIHRYPHVARWYNHMASLQYQHHRSISPQTIAPSTTTSSSEIKSEPATAVSSGGNGKAVFRSTNPSELPATPGMAHLAKFPAIPVDGYVFDYIEGGGTTHTAEILGAPPGAVFKTMVGSDD